MKTTISRLLLYGIIGLFLTTNLWTTFAQNNNSSSCDLYEPYLSWPQHVVRGQPVQYTLWIDTTFDQLFSEEKQPTMTISLFEQRNRIENRQSTWIFDYTFEWQWPYDLVITYQYKWCSYTLQRQISTYESIIFYAWMFISDFNTNLEDNIKQNDIYLSKIILENTTPEKNQLEELFFTQRTFIEQSTHLYFAIDSYNHLFTAFDMLENEWLFLDDKKIIFITKNDKLLIKKFLASYIQRSQRDNIYIISDDQFSRGLLALSIGKKQLLDTIIGTSLSFRVGWLQYSLGRFLDSLIYHGFPIEFVWLLLSLGLCVVILVFIKQVIWLPAYGMYYPLLYWLLFYAIGERLSLWLFAAALIAHIISQAFTKRFALLVYGKMWLYFILYIMSTIIWFWLFSFFFASQRDLSWLQEWLLLVAFIAVWVSAKKVFGEGKKFLSFKWWSHITWFLLLSYILFFVYTSEAIQFSLLVRPGILFLLVVIIVILGRFTGLQFVEYIRFSPLINKQLSRKKKQ